MKLSISTALYYKKHYKEVLDLIAQTGFKKIELFLNQTFIDVPVEEIKREVDQRGLKIVSIHTPLEFMVFPQKQSEAYWIEKAYEMAKVLGAKLMVTHMVIGEYFEELPGGIDKLHQANLKKYSQLEDIIMTTENIPGYSGNKFLGDMEELKKFISEHNIGLTFDVTHCGASGLPLIETFDSIKEYVRNIHLSDFENGNEHKLLGDGELDIEGFLKYLVKENYQGFVTLELDFENKMRNDIITFTQARERLGESYKYLVRILGE